MIAEANSELQGRQHSMLKLALGHITMANKYLPEISAFKICLEEREAARLTLTGLPTCLRSLLEAKSNLESVAARLVSDDLTYADLGRLWKQFDKGAVVIAQGAAKWDVLKRCGAFVAVNQNFQGSSKALRRKKMSGLTLSGRDKYVLHKTMKGQARVQVDVVDWGKEWVDLRTVSQERLARQMTDCGWGWGDHEVGDAVDPDEWSDIPLARQVAKLCAAARTNRSEYEIPRVRVVLTGIDRSNEDICIFLDQLQRMDELVSLHVETRDGPFLTTELRPLHDALRNLVGDKREMLTPRLNIDHTILVDLISDITHQRLVPQPWQAQTTQVQIVEENKEHDGLMVKALYSILAGRELVCTKDAATQFHEMLKTVGTATERRRGKLLLPVDEEILELGPNQIRREFEALSVHSVPQELQIPVTILETETWTMSRISAAIKNCQLPAVAMDVARLSRFKSSKLSVIMYGWASGDMTITSNKEVKGQIRTWVEAQRHNDTERGPKIWKVGVTRNLLSKNATQNLEEWQRAGSASELAI